VDQGHIYEEYKKMDFSNCMCKSIEIIELKNGAAKSWKQKLELIHNILETIELENKELAAIGGYLQLISNGQISCAEEGTHYRPNNHAKIALSIYTMLTGKINKENSFLVKTILKNLPSFSSKFRSDVPLTRIRDIAHRGDIPHVSHRQ
jgi:phosphoglucan,water dikinase